MPLFTYINLLTLNGRMTVEDELGKRLSGLCWSTVLLSKKRKDGRHGSCKDRYISAERMCEIQNKYWHNVNIRVHGNGIIVVFFIVVLSAFYANVYATVVSFWILSYSVFISHPTIRHYRAGCADSSDNHTKHVNSFFEQNVVCGRWMRLCRL